MWLIFGDLLDRGERRIATHTRGIAIGAFAGFALATPLLSSALLEAKAHLLFPLLRRHVQFGRVFSLVLFVHLLDTLSLMEVPGRFQAVDEGVALDAYTFDRCVSYDIAEVLGIKGKGDLGTKVFERCRGRFPSGGFKVRTVRSAATGCERGSWAARKGLGEGGHGLFWEEGIDDGLWGPEPWGGHGIHEGFEMADTGRTKNLSWAMWLVKWKEIG